MATTTTTPAATIFSAASNHHHPLHLPSKLPFSSKPPHLPLKPITKLHVQGRTQDFNTEYSSNPITSTTTTTTSKTNPNQEIIFFDGGAHYGDLVANLFLGFTLVWLPLTLAACLRAFFLRYRFTNLRVTVVSGLTGQERSDFSYKVIKDVQVVPRFIGEWGDIIITLKDGTKVDLRSVPKFREIAKYCLSMADQPAVVKESGAKGF
ncbi:oxidoreductase [Lithospermum erythrorhizon]|uniref:Oxidoreductase n=1 Tax=Lithospermum erythrorhizon TaxID=34254 RepID=A0AAV3QA18_LITER